MPNSESASTAAVAMAGYMIAAGLVFSLRKRGALHPGDLIPLLDGSTFSLERFGLADDARREAHMLLEQMIQVLKTPLSPPSPE